MSLTIRGTAFDKRWLRHGLGLIHPWEVDPDQPRIKARLLNRFRHYNDIRRSSEWSR